MGFNRRREVPCEVSKGNQQWVETCVYQEGEKDKNRELEKKYIHK